MSARRLDAAVPETLRTLRRYVGLLAEAGLTEGEAADALGVRRARYREVQRLVGAWHASEAARMRRAETAWRHGRGD